MKPTRDITLYPGEKEREGKAGNCSERERMTSEETNKKFSKQAEKHWSGQGCDSICSQNYSHAMEAEKHMEAS